MKVFLIILCCAVVQGVMGQKLTPHVINSAGWHQNADKFRVTHSIGEPIITTLTSTKLIITQGFLQTDPDTSKETGIDERFELARITIYPNPSQMAIWVKGDLRGNEKLSLFDAQGQEVLATSVKARLPVSVAHLSPGIYTIRILDLRHQRYYTGKLQKQP